ncbi:MAG TPA: hypothetical protein PLK06_01050 [bacterium]|nr:hypothetical protein [bacterium]
MYLLLVEQVITDHNNFIEYLAIVGINELYTCKGGILYVHAIDTDADKLQQTLAELQNMLGAGDSLPNPPDLGEVIVVWMNGPTGTLATYSCQCSEGGISYASHEGEVIVIIHVGYDQLKAETLLTDENMYLAYAIAVAGATTENDSPSSLTWRTIGEA